MKKKQKKFEFSALFYIINFFFLSLLVGKNFFSNCQAAIFGASCVFKYLTDYIIVLEMLKRKVGPGEKAGLFFFHYDNGKGVTSRTFQPKNQKKIFKKGIQTFFLLKSFILI